MYLAILEEMYNFQTGLHSVWTRVGEPEWI